METSAICNHNFARECYWFYCHFPGIHYFVETVPSMKLLPLCRMVQNYSAVPSGFARLISRYGVSFQSSKSILCSAAVVEILYAISRKIEQRYKGTRLYTVYICIYIIPWHWNTSFWVSFRRETRASSPIQHSQYRGYWWPGDSRRLKEICLGFPSKAIFGTLA